MKSKKSSAGGILFRITGFLLAGVMTSMVFLGALTLDTNSWFTSKMVRNMEVSAASTEDILEYFDIHYDNNGNNKSAIGIRLKKAEGIEYTPIIYFKVGGDAADYILHINPIRLEGNGEHYIPIDLNINSVQREKLNQLGQNEKIRGTITAKYLNGFISEVRDISFRRKYLTDKYDDEIIRNLSSIGEISNVITNIASLIDWPVITLDKNYRMDSAPKTIQNFETQNVLSKDSEQEADTVQLLEVPIDKFVLSSEQSKIINVIAPTLQKYLDNLYDLAVNLIKKINEQIRIIAGLEEKIEILDEEAIVLNQQLEEISIEKDNLSKENENFKNENQDLKNQNQDLMKEIEDLKDQIENLKLSLRSERSASDTNTQSLREEVARLEEELKNEKSSNVEPPKEAAKEEETEEIIENSVEETDEKTTEDKIEEEPIDSEEIVEVDEEATEDEVEEKIEAEEDPVDSEEVVKEIDENTTENQVEEIVEVGEEVEEADKDIIKDKEEEHLNVEEKPMSREKEIKEDGAEKEVAQTPVET